jgi:hypothetical protein
LISESEVEEALEEARPFREQFVKIMEELKSNPSIKEKPRWYTDITKAYRRAERGEIVKKRFELQKSQPGFPIETHIMRIGEIAFATNPFELYLDYAVCIRELSKAVQTFLVQKAGSSGTYLPSGRSTASKGYGSVPASTEVGPEGGQKLVDMTVKSINGMFD